MSRRRIPFVRTIIRKKYKKKVGVKIFKTIAEAISESNRQNFYCVTVIFRAAAWLVAEVAVTVKLEIPGGVPVVGLC